MATATATLASVYTGAYAPEINAAARRYGISSYWLAALLWTESRMHPTAVSKTGDYGIAQINRAAHPEVTQAEAENPSFAIPWAAAELSRLKAAKGGSLPQAIEAYNVGASASASVIAAAGKAYLDQVSTAYSQLRSGKLAPAPSQADLAQVLKPAAGVDMSVDPRLLTGLYRLGLASGKTITIISGRRSASSRAGYLNDPHQRGLAVDAYVGGKPIGDVFSLAQLASVGLQGGNTANFYQGKPDPEHVQMPNAGVDKAMSYTPPAAGGSWWSGVAAALSGAGSSAWNAASSAASAAESAAGGIPSWLKTAAEFNPTTGPLAAVGGLLTSGGLSGIEKMIAVFTDPARYLKEALLYVLFLFLGFALLYVGVTRLLGARHIVGAAAVAPVAA
jgi:hypothetical protein